MQQKKINKFKELLYKKLIKNSNFRKLWLLEDNPEKFYNLFCDQYINCGYSKIITANERKHRQWGLLNSQLFNINLEKLVRKCFPWPYVISYEIIKPKSNFRFLILKFTICPIRNPMLNPWPHEDNPAYRYNPKNFNKEFDVSFVIPTKIIAIPKTYKELEKLNVLLEL